MLALTPLDKNQRDRLILVRQLHAKAQRELGDPWPLKAAALLTEHDAVELFLGLACQACGRTVTPKTTFHQYFDLLRNGTPPILLHEETEMIRLNTARVSLKHHGILPDESAVDGFAHSATSFLVRNTDDIWGQPLGSISLVGLISDGPIRKALEQCETLLAAGSICLKEISIAFAMVTDAADSARRGEHFAPHISPLFHHHAQALPRELERFFEQVVNAIEDIRSDIATMSYQLDHRRLKLFKKKSCYVYQVIGGDYVASDPPPLVTLRDARESFDFVVDAALRIQAFYL